MELQEALSQISEIRRQMAKAELFRGYRAVPVAGTGLLALAAAWVQSCWIAEPTEQLAAYLALWIGTAALGLLWAGGEVVVRAGRSSGAMERRATWAAVEQFLPCLVAGALVTAVLVRREPEAAWMLPGLWQVFFALGVFASSRILPRPIVGVAGVYLLTGLACLAWAREDQALSPWAMGLPFGLGQGIAAAVLYLTLERDDERHRRR